MSLHPSRRPATLVLATLLLWPATRLGAQDDELAKAAAAKATEQLAAIQKKLAAGSDIAQRLRVEGFSAAGGRVKVSGVFIEPAFAPPKETPDAKKQRPPFEVLDDELRAIVKDAVKEVAKDKQLLFDLSGITRLEGKDHPHVILQKAANDLGTKAGDQIRLDGSHFTANGTLAVVGIRGMDNATTVGLEGVARKVLEKNPAALKDGKVSVSFTQVRPVEWKLAPAEVQKLLARSGDPALERLRVDRVYLAHNPDNPDPVDRWGILRLTLTGVRLGEEKVDGEQIGTLCRRQWEDFFKGPTRIQMNAGPLLGPGVEEPVDRLRKLIAARPELDGVRVDAGGRFGPGGELLLAGIRPRAPDAPAARAVEKGVGECYKEVLGDLIAVGDAAAERYKKLAAGPGVSLGGMTEADTRRILHELQEWARKNRDDVRFSRLYFGPDGGLKLLCEATSERDFEDAKGKFKELAPEFYPAAPKDEKKQPLAGKGPTPAVETTTIPAFTAFLRKQLADDPQKRWSAVLIERGYFDDAGRYQLRGVVDTREQNTELARLIETFAGDPKWKAYFTPPRPKGRPLTLDVIPMAELVERVQRVTPSYPVFDGVQIRNAFYDKDANLVFGAHVVGQPRLNEGRTLLASLVAQHPDFSRRLASSQNPRDPKLRIEVLPPDPTPPDDQLAEFSIGYAAAALAAGDMGKAKKWIDTALLHYPHESAAWFLSAYYNLLKGDRELVRRDLYRVVAIEGPLDFNGPFQRKRRYSVAKDLQGEKRDELEKLWLECFKEVKDGQPKPMTLTPAK